MRQSERRRLAPVVDLTSDLNSEADFNMSSSHRNNHGNNQMSKQNKNGNMQLNLKANSGTDSDIKTPDFDEAFQVNAIKQIYRCYKCPSMCIFIYQC